MTGIPSEIDLTRLPGPARGKPPALYFRDEIVWSPDDSHFALAYTIVEASYGNEVGSLLWGSSQSRNVSILGNPDRPLVTCWFVPWCAWASPSVFLFKSQFYDGRLIRSGG